MQQDLPDHSSLRIRSDREAATFSKLVIPFAMLSIASMGLSLAGCDSGWSGPHKEAGPLPLSSPDIPVVRLVDKRKNFEQGKMQRLLWDEGKGPTLAEERIKPLLDSIPKELNDRLQSTRNVPANLYQVGRDTGDTGTTYEYIYETREIVVSLNPDVLIVSVNETPVGPHDSLPRSWDSLSIDQARREYLSRCTEFVTGGPGLSIGAGTLVPWSKEMLVFSNDPRVKSGRLIFVNSRAEVLLPVGKLMLVRNDDDVIVSRVTP